MNQSVSVVIPCYNGSPFLRETLDSVLNQTHNPLEVLVVDDGSTDDSAAIAQSYGQPVRVLRQRNQGESVARNRGIEESRGDWIAFLDADDAWKPTKLQRQLEAIRPDVACVHTNYQFFGTSDIVRDLSKTPEQRRYSLEYFLLGKSPLQPSTVMVSASLATRFPDWTQYAEDTIYFVEVSRQGRIVLVPEVLADIRSHSGSQSAAPGVAARWHETFEQWLQQNENRLNAQCVRRLRRSLLEQLTHRAFRAYYKQKQEEYDHLREYLTQFAEHPVVKPLFGKRMPARWAYKTRRALCKVVRGAQRRGRTAETAEWVEKSSDESTTSGTGQPGLRPRLGKSAKERSNA